MELTSYCSDEFGDLTYTAQESPFGLFFYKRCTTIIANIHILPDAPLATPIKLHTPFLRDIQKVGLILQFS